MKKLIVATRGSRLALAQTHIVCRLLEEAGVETEIRTITTAGDRDRIHALVKSAAGGSSSGKSNGNCSAAKRISPSTVPRIFPTSWRPGW